ncbi:MAG: hypothetical protein KatS3mg057_3061 [Herpetosiphonaceae bacterium]|nr:MAG: hypothetical protein KatS3mg057_3061 [Herpetosiphonaceae bacterium]
MKILSLQPAHIVVVLAILGGLLLLSPPWATASSCSTAASGSWSSPSTWADCGGGVPGSGDSVTINHAVTLDTSPTIAALTVSASGALMLDTSVPRTLQVAGDVLSGGTMDLSGGSASDALIVGGALTIESGSFTATAGLISVAGGFQHSGGTFVHNGGRVLLNNATDQSLNVLGLTVFNDLIINNGLVGYWKLDEGAGSNTADSSGYGNTGTLSSPSWTTVVPPAVSYTNPAALDFDGSDDSVTIADESSFDLQGQITIAAWIKVDSFNKNWQAIITKGDSAWRLHRYNDRDTVAFGTSGLSNTDLESSSSINDGQWHHIAAVYDGSRKSIYIDGALDASVAASGSIATNDWPVLIGENAEMSGRHFDGQIDDVRIYNRALSEEEIANLGSGGQPDIVRATTTITNGPLEIEGDLLLNAGTLDVGINNYSINVAGNWINNGGHFTPRDGTVLFNGMNAQEISAEPRFFNLTVSNTGTSPDDSVVADSALAVAGTLRVSDGQFQPVDGSSFVDVVIEAGGTLTPDSGASLSVSGDWSSQGSFDANGGTVSFTGAAGQSISGTTSFYHLTIANTSANPGDTNDVDPDSALAVAGTLRGERRPVPAGGRLDLRRCGDRGGRHAHTRQRGEPERQRRLEQPGQLQRQRRHGPLYRRGGAEHQRHNQLLSPDHR